VKSNIVYQYFKKDIGGKTLYVQIDPIQLKGSQLTVPGNIKEATPATFEEAEFESNILQTLQDEGYEPANAIEFHLILNGLI